jgi:lipopolysaccharide/colanic/teichoic acid biosynthesis glycosyltransferase
MRRAARPVLYLGVLVIVFGLARIHASFIGHYDLTGSGRFWWTVTYAGILCMAAYGFGLPDLPRSKRAALGASVGAAFAGAATISLVQLFVGDALLPRFVVFGSAVMLPDWYRICSGLASGGRLRAEARDRVVLIANDREASALMAELGQTPENPASVLVQLVPAAAVPEGDRRPLVDAAQDATVVVLSAAAQADDAIVAQAAELHARGLRVRTLTAFYEEWLGKLPLSELERASMLFDIGEVHRVRYSRAKRLLDVLMAALGLIPLAVILPLVALANLAGNRGPLLYRQARVGKGGVEFTIVKMRTMRPTGAGELANEWTTEDDPRITRVGRVLRVTHLDELPQVLNILRGDLSVVGPRPEQPRYVEELTEKLPFYQLRHSVRPGLTGWAQVKYGYAGDESDTLEKLQYEFWYLRHQSLLLDARVIGRTVRSVTGREGRGR